MSPVKRTAVSALILAGLAGVGLVQRAPATASEVSESACHATTVRYGPVKQPGLGDVPWLLAAPQARGVIASLVSYRVTSRDGRVNRSAGAVIWTRGEELVWSHPTPDSPATLIARQLDGSSSFAPELRAEGPLLHAAPRFPAPGCWRLTLLNGSIRASVVVRVVEPPARLGCDATPVNRNGLTPVTPASSGIGAGWSWFTDGGRALLYTGGRTPGGGNTKVPWWVRRGWAPTLSLSGRRLDGADEFRQSFPMALSPEGVFPSIIDVPTAGCWLLTARTGALAGILVARVVAARAPDAAEVIERLRSEGLPMREQRSVEQPFFAPSAPGARVFANPRGDMQLWEFSDAKRSRAAAASVSKDGSSIRSGGAMYEVEWVAPPHWFRLGRVIVLYLGDDATVITALGSVLGHQFAGH